MPKHDYRCEGCGREKTDVWESNWSSSTGRKMPINCDCGLEMEKVPAAPNFNVKGFNARNSYGIKSGKDND